MASVKMRSYRNNSWCSDHRACSEEELQEMAGKIRENCTVKEIDNESYLHCCTILENKNLGLKYWIHDDLGHISEIIEARSY